MYWPSLTDEAIYWSLNVATIVYVPVSFYSPYLLTKPNGMRRSVQIGAFFSFLSAAIRIPCTFGGYRFRNSGFCMVLLQLGGVFCGIAGPFTQGSPSRFSSIWFPSSEQTRATAIGFLGKCVDMLLLEVDNSKKTLNQIIHT